MSAKRIVLALFLMAGCTREASTLVADDAQAVFDTVENAPLSERTFMFTNGGDEKTEPLVVQLTGDVHAFAINSDTCSGVALKGGDRCGVAVQLRSDDPGAFDGELHVTTPTLAAAVLLSGKVTPAQLEVVAQGSPNIDVVQGATVSLKLAVTNVGGATSGVLGVAKRSVPYDNVDDGCSGQTLVGGATCMITLSRVVSSEAPLGPSEGTIDVGATPGGALSAAVGVNVLLGGALILEDAYFGTIPTLGNVKHTVKISNPGPVSAGPMTLTIDGEANVFGISAGNSCAGVELHGGQSCTVDLYANLVDTNTHTATLRARANFVKPGSSNVSATGVRAHYSVTFTAVSGGGGGTGKVRFVGVDNAGPITYLFANKTAAGPFTGIADTGSSFGIWGGNAPCAGSGSTVCSFTGADNSDLTLTASFIK